MTRAVCAGGDLAGADAAIAARGLTLGMPLVRLGETVSTNDDAKRGARAGASHGSVWLAESQTGGRGRQGRSWLSPRGENLMFSVLMRVRCAPARVPPLSLAVGLVVRDAVARALGAASDLDVVVKWPNDVLVRRPGERRLRKVAGILVESSVIGQTVDHAVIGVGINVHSRALPEPIAAIATSLALERDARGLSGDLDRASILADVLAGLALDVETVAHAGLSRIHARLARYDALAGKEVGSADAPSVVLGVACGIDTDGRLLVRKACGTRITLSSGEICVRAV